MIMETGKDAISTNGSYLTLGSNTSVLFRHQFQNSAYLKVSHGKESHDVSNLEGMKSLLKFMRKKFDSYSQDEASINAKEVFTISTKDVNGIKKTHKSFSFYPGSWEVFEFDPKSNKFEKDEADSTSFGEK